MDEEMKINRMRRAFCCFLKQDLHIMNSEASTAQGESILAFKELGEQEGEILKSMGFAKFNLDEYLFSISS